MAFHKGDNISRNLGNIFSFLPKASVPVYSQCAKHLMVILTSLNRKNISSLEFWYISNIFYYFSFCLRKNMKPACKANGFWHVHSIWHSSTMRHILKGKCVEGAFWRVYLQRKERVVVSAFKRGLHCFTLKNDTGKSDRLLLSCLFCCKEGKKHALKVLHHW